MSRFAVTFYVFGAVMALLSVCADAFAAHGLVTMAPAMEQAVVWFKEGANFQMNHALALLIAVAVSERLPAGRAQSLMRLAVVGFAAGIVMFSGALYSISFAGPGFFAPWGGFAVMIGWLLFAAGAVIAARKSASGG